MAYKIRRTMAGVKIVQSPADKLAFYGATPVVQPSGASQGALTAGPGSVDGTIADVGAAFNQTTLNNNFADLTDRVNALRTALVNLGLIKGSA